MIDFGIVGASLFSSAVLAALFWLLLKKWLLIRMEKSIDQEYKKKLEEFKYEFRKREQAAQIAELLSRWLNLKDESKRELNRLSFEVFLWLPDEIVLLLSARLKNEPNAPNVQDILLAVRKVIQKSNSPSIRSEHVVFFGTK